MLPSSSLHIRNCLPKFLALLRTTWRQGLSRIYEPGRTESPEPWALPIGRSRLVTAHSEDSEKILMRSAEPLRGQATKSRISGSLLGECCRSIFRSRQIRSIRELNKDKNRLQSIEALRLERIFFFIDESFIGPVWL